MPYRPTLKKGCLTHDSLVQLVDSYNLQHLSDVLGTMPRQRSKKNRDVKAGTANCQWGLCKKGNTLAETYNVDVVVVTRRPDGFLGGFQSRPGLMQELCQLSVEDALMGPDQFKSGRHQFFNTLRPSSGSTNSGPSPIPTKEDTSAMLDSLLDSDTPRGSLERACSCTVGIRFEIGARRVFASDTEHVCFAIFTWRLGRDGYPVGSFRLAIAGASVPRLQAVRA